MIVRNLLQGGNAWLQWREEGITSSPAATICGLNPHMTPYQLFAEEMGWLRKANLKANPNVRRGNAREEPSRQRVEDKLKVVLTPLCAEWDQDPLHRSSLDGMMPNKRPVELKNPSDKVFDEVKRDGWNSVHVKQHACQVQHQIMVTGSDAGLLVFSSETEDIPFFMPRNQQFIDWMRPKLEYFKSCLDAGNGIEPDPARDILVAHRGPNKDVWRDAEVKVANIDSRLKALRIETEELENQRLRIQEALEQTLGDYVKAESEQLKLTQYEQKGKIDYYSALQSLRERHADAFIGFNLDTFRYPTEKRAKLTYRQS